MANSSRCKFVIPILNAGCPFRYLMIDLGGEKKAYMPRLVASVNR